ncbi:MAG: AAA family ATPase [Candidatus Beckwithbacteria bacterium]
MSFYQIFRNEFNEKMNYYIKSLSLRKDSLGEFRLEKDKDDDADFYLLDNLSKVNIFVGPNNSRKSRFIRLIASQPNYTFETDDPIYHELINTPHIFLGQVKKVLQKYDLTDYGSLIQIFASFEKETPFIMNKFVNTHQPYSFDITKYFQQIEGITGNQNCEGRPLNDEEQQELRNELKSLVTDYKSKFESGDLKNDLPAYSFKRIYIPTLRGFRQFPEIDVNIDPYVNKTKNDYFEGLPEGQNPPTIFSGYNIYRDNHKLANNHALAVRAKKKAFEGFVSENFYENKRVEIISAEDTKLVHLIVGGEEDREVQNIGDGIQQLVLLFFSMFQHLGEKALFFIEEPELFMHPGMQRQFLKNIYSKEEFKDFQFFLTTHSNHFLDMTIDYRNVSIFRCDKEINPPGSNKSFTWVKNVDSPDGSVLSSLGVRNSSVFLANSTIWVEGVTDRKYIRHFLELYQKNLIEKGKLEEHQVYKEDLHYAFVEYGGSSVAHWNEDEDDKESINVTKLAGRMFLIADRDDKNKSARHEKLEKMLNERFYLLPSREIENLVAPEVLRKVISIYEKKDEEDIPKPDYRVYKTKYLGEYLENLLGDDRTRKSYSVKTSAGKGTGTINDKDKFCEKVIGKSTNLEDLSNDAKALIVKVFNYIKNQNKN